MSVEKFARISVAAIALALAFGGSAKASIVIDTGNAGGFHQNVQFQDGSSVGDSLTTLTNANTSVTFTGTEQLESFAGGQARISGSDGNLTALSWELTAPNTGYTLADFKLNPSQSNGATLISITVTDQFGNLFTCPLCSIPSSGFFNVQASAGELITEISILANGQLDDVRQVRLDGVTQISAVPESSTWAMLIIGFMGIGFIAYRRNSNLAPRAVC